MLSDGLATQKQFSNALGKADDAVVTLIQNGQLELDVYEDGNDYVGDDNLVEPIHN